MNVQKPSEKIQELLSHWQQGHKASLEELVTLLYDDLKALAGSYMKLENKGHTLQPTALVNEVYLEMMGRDKRLQFNDRDHFMRTACLMMRRFLMDYARIRGAEKRGGAFKDTLEEEKIIEGVRKLDPESLMSLEQALDRMEKRHPRQARLLQLRIFMGFSNKELAEALEISPATVKRDWTEAKQRLYLEMNR